MMALEMMRKILLSASCNAMVIFRVIFLHYLDMAKKTHATVYIYPIVVLFLFSDSYVRAFI